MAVSRGRTEVTEKRGRAEVKVKVTVEGLDQASHGQDLTTWLKRARRGRGGSGRS